MAPDPVRDTLQIGILILTFLGVLWVTYITTKKLAQMKQGTMHNKNMQIIESMAVGPNQYMHIIRVGQVYHLVATSKDNVSYCSLVEGETLRLESPEVKSFKEQLNSMRYKKQEKSNEETKQP